MGQRIVGLVMLAALAGCGSQANQQLEAVKSARSVLAEWALVEEHSSRGLAPETYVEQTRSLARDALRTSEGQLRAQPRAAALIRQVRQGQPDAAVLRRANKALEPLEDSLESA